MNHCQHVWSFCTAICYLLTVHIYTWTKSCVTQEKIGRLAWHLLHRSSSAFPTSPHQLPSAPSTFAATPLPHLSDTPACLTPPHHHHHHPLASSLSHLSSFFANVPFALSLSLPPLPSLPPRAPCFEPGLESVHPEVCHWADVLISGWGNALRRAERGQGPGLGSSAWTCCLHKRWEKLVLPWCSGIWTDSVVSVWYGSPSMRATLTESMAYDSEITGLCSRSSIVILGSLSLSVSQYQSQLGPLAIHFINKHDCPEVHAQLFIMRVSQAESFVTDPILHSLGWCSSRRDLLSVTASGRAEEAGMLDAEN